MQRRSSATWLALGYAVLVVYASLYPFWPWRMPPSLPWPGVVGLPWPRYWIRFDIWANAAGYWPLGLLCVAAVMRSGKGPAGALLLAGVGLPLLSFSMETLQYFLPARVPSLADFLLNSAGAWLGGLCGWALHRFGGLQRWTGWRERWFVPHSAGALALLAVWPVGLLYPSPMPLGLGQLFPRLRALAEDMLAGTPWEMAPDASSTELPLPPGLEAIAIAMGLLAPCLLALSVARAGWLRRMVLVTGAGVLGLAATAWSTVLNFGPDHAWSWLTPTTWPGLVAGGVLALLAGLLSRRANAAWGLVVLTALIALVSEAPADPYLAESLQAWEQGRFVNLYGLAQWVGWLWPFTALAWLLYGVTQSDAAPSPLLSVLDAQGPAEGGPPADRGTPAAGQGPLAAQAAQAPQAPLAPQAPQAPLAGLAPPGPLPAGSPAPPDVFNGPADAARRDQSHTSRAGENPDPTISP